MIYYSGFIFFASSVWNIEVFDLEIKSRHKKRNKVMTQL